MNTRWKRVLWAGLGGPLALFLVLNLLFPLPVQRLHPQASAVVLDREGTLLRAFLAPDEMWRIRVTSADVAPALRQAVVAYEDRRFYRHPGVDPVGVGRAAVANLRAGRVVQGGSTLTMQVARMMARKDRTFRHKMVEAFRALQLELWYSKDEILTLYFNWAPYGGNLVGVGAASHFYFDKAPDQLSLGEAALLAAIPNNPNAYRPDLYPAAARLARDRVLGLLAEGGVITVEQHRTARTEPVPGRRFDLPFLAPHLADHLIQTRKDAEHLETTIDARLQERAEALLNEHLTGLQGQGITNGAVVILDNQTMEVLALVGSRAFFDKANNGQVNGAMAPRSPGSALKPFIYALAFDRGLVAPHNMLYDVPVDYNGYRPENYDRTYTGIIAADEALVRSLNVPAVNLAAKLHGDGLYEFLQAAHATTLTEPSHHYGLALILGGGEVTLLELTALYAGLANEGSFRPARLLRTEPEPEEKKLIDLGAAYLTTEILSRLRRPELPAVWEWSRDLPKVAWKTGTSYGHRDAWSVGYTPRYTVGVWIGNMDGAGAPGLVGAEVAAPLLFNLFTVLEASSSRRWFVPPADIEMRRICSASGDVATPFCPATREAPFLPGRSPIRACTVHEPILVDRKTGYRLCSNCKLGRDYHEEVVEHWPAEIAGWMERHGVPLETIPEHLPGCSRLADGAPPVIRSPRPEAVYRLRRGIDPAHQQILLDASVSNQSQTIYWFVDGNLVYSGDPAERVFWTPSVGMHTLLVIDDEGRSTEVSITVQQGRGAG